jgi:predicted phage terminase large subunit-like protein
MTNKIIPQDLVDQMTKDKKVRVAITKESFSYFFHFYYAHYVKYATADFQKEIIHLLEKGDRENLFVVAFRGSGKSTMITTAYPIWAILGKQQKKFITIFCQTQAQAKQHMMNLRRELEDNDLLKNDLGPFREDSDEWGSHSLVFSNTDARITVASVEQSIRGLRHHEHRPDLIICDDVEDITSTKTREGRNKTYQWLRGEVIPAGDKNTRLVVVGNLLHEDSLLMRLKDDVENNNADGNFLYFPLINTKGECLWLGKYPTNEDIEMEKRKVGDEIAWQREYLLNIIPDDDQVIYPEWIKRYKVDKLPPETHKAFRGTYSGVDLAISIKDTADFTAIVTARVFGRNERLRIFILPQPINKKLTFPQQVELLKMHYDTELNKENDRLFVESVAYQDALPQMLDSQGIKAEGVKPQNDKRTRLALTSSLIKNGTILFPETGCEQLIEQMTGFGIEKHDDLADAFSLLIHKIIELHTRESTVIMMLVSFDDDDDDNDGIVYYSDYYDVLDDYDCVIPTQKQ